MKLVIISIGIIFLISLVFQQQNYFKNNNPMGEVVVETIGFEYWENCETGLGECLPLNFQRPQFDEKWILKMPCGGSLTDVILTKENEKNPIQKINITFEECPPIFDLTKLRDGKYFASMLACGLGGTVEFNLNTKK